MKMSLRKTLGVASLLSLSLAAASQAHAAVCSYTLNNEWNTGFQGTVSITNNGTTAINGWTVGWSYANNRITNSWNATLTGNNPYSASALNWNSTIQPGQSVTFGVQGNKNGSTAEIPTITGSVCSSVTSSSSVPTTSSSSAPSSTPRSSSSSVVSISSSSQASQCAAVSQCNWYGTLYPTCTTTASGWGYENGKSCISTATCAAQPSPFGVVAGCGVTSSSATTSSAATSSSSSVRPSSSSISSSSSIATSPSSSSVASVSSSSVVSISSRSSSSLSSSSSSVTSAGPRMDNPFVGAQWYIDPIWSAKAMAETGGSKVANYNTAVWMDRIGAIAPTDGSWGLRDHLDAALDQNANVIQVVVYDLPNRDCHALASNGELTQGVEGTTRYRTEYVDVLASIFADPKYRSLRIIAIIEPDSLPNLVTNLSTPACQQAADATHGYVPNTRYTLSKFYPITNVYSYVDIGHSGWLGWTDNFGKAVTLIGDAIKGATGGVNSVAGFVSNTSGYTPLYEPFLDSLANSAFPGSGGGTQTRQAKFYEWNPHFSEVSFVTAWRNAMIAAGFPSNIGMLVDTSRNGWGGANRPTAQSTSTVLDTFVDQSRIDRRAHRGNWCNQRGGVGERPQVAPVAGIDAYVWVKPPGESDGAASLELSYDPQDPAKGFDRNCDPTFTNASGTNTGAMPNAPVAGRWFSAGFKQLVDNAYPPLE
ncbi:MAG TPA: glycoside hydrolase family 6 protein [Cellvibrio sp.]